MRLSKLAFLVVSLLPAAELKDLDFLAGDWVGEGTGAPGEATGGFSFERDLQGKVLIRRNHADYPAAKDRPAFRHDDLMVVHEESGELRAAYWDNEGHVIHYRISVAPAEVTFLSDAVAGQPRFRFRYKRVAADRLGITFEMAPPGKPEDFKPYIEAAARRSKR